MSRNVIDILASESGLPPTAILRIVANAPERYKVFKIPKRTGGEREIAQPTPEVKLLQRILCRSVLINFPIHEQARAYRPGSSTRDNALFHAGHTPIMKIDFQNFFPSLRARDWQHLASDEGLLDPEEIKIMSRLMFRRPSKGRILRLSIGAPSSPMLSNILMFKFDQILNLLCERENIRYTRYADDLTFSAERTGFFNGIDKKIRKAISQSGGLDLHINHAKTVIATTAYSRQVTGVTLSNDGRVTIGRKQKHNLRARIHHFKSGVLNIDDRERLSGYLSYIKSVEPSYIASLEEIWGKKVISRIFAIKPRRRSRNKRQF